MNGEALAEQRDVEEAAQPRVGADDGEPAARIPSAPCATTKGSEELGIGVCASAEIDAPANAGSTVRLGAGDEHDRARRACDLEPQLHHGSDIPAESPIETGAPMR